MICARDYVNSRISIREKGNNGGQVYYSVAIRDLAHPGIVNSSFSELPVITRWCRIDGHSDCRI